MRHCVCGEQIKDSGRFCCEACRLAFEAGEDSVKRPTQRYRIVKRPGGHVSYWDGGVWQGMPTEGEATWCDIETAYAALDLMLRRHPHARLEPFDAPGAVEWWGVLDYVAGRWMAPFDLSKSLGELWADDLDGARLYEHAAEAQEAVDGMEDLPLTAERIRITDGVREHIKREPATTKACVTIFERGTEIAHSVWKSVIVDIGQIMDGPTNKLNTEYRQGIRDRIATLYGFVNEASVRVTFDDECHDCSAYIKPGAFCDNPNCPETR